MIRQEELFFSSPEALLLLDQHQESRPLRRVIVSYSRPIRFVGLDSEHAQNDERFANWC